VGPVETQTALEPVPGLPFPFSLVEDPDLQPPEDLDQRAENCGVHVLMTLDESTYTNNGDAMGDHPIAWCHDYEGGHAFYTGLGHTEASYTEANFIGHVTGGVLIAAGIEPCA
jgi:type 1 glutamine amidotransferase